jgi:hypothetical protein
MDAPVEAPPPTGWASNQQPDKQHTIQSLLQQTHKFTTTVYIYMLPFMP